MDEYPLLVLFDVIPAPTPELVGFCVVFGFAVWIVRAVVNGWMGKD